MAWRPDLDRSPADLGGDTATVDGPPGGVGAAAVAFVASVVLALVAGSIAIVAGAAAAGPVANAATFVGEWVGFVGVPVWLSRNRGTGRLSRDFGLRLGGPGDIGLGLVAGIGSVVAVSVYSALISHFDHVNLGHEAHSLFDNTVGAGFLLVAVCTALAAPFAEELFFRGLVQGALQRRIGAIGGLLLTAVVFGFVHLGSNPIEAVPPLILFGVVLGALAWRTGRLGPGIVAHMTFNGITVAALAVSR